MMLFFFFNFAVQPNRPDHPQTHRFALTVTSMWFLFAMGELGNLNSQNKLDWFVDSCILTSSMGVFLFQCSIKESPVQ